MKLPPMCGRGRVCLVNGAACAGYYFEDLPPDGDYDPGVARFHGVDRESHVGDFLHINFTLGDS